MWKLVKRVSILINLKQACFDLGDEA
jgi:hypothetical protein